MINRYRPQPLRRRWSAALVLVLAASVGGRLPAQSGAERLRQQREELDRIRRERADLERQMRELRTTVHTLSEERLNLDRQADATARVVRGLDQQILSLGQEEDDATADLVATQDELVIKEAVLRHRVREIYKRGGLYSFEAMLSAQSFGELLARYKYLRLVAMRDRALVGRVAALGDQIAAQRTSLVKLRNDAEQSREDKSAEERRLRALEQQRGRSLAQAEQQQERIQARLQQMQRDEARLAQLLASADDARRREEARPGGAPAAPSTLRTADLGRLDWPVEGDILYRFGRRVNPNNTVVSWLGIGIGAPTGTPVKAINAGRVLSASRVGTYGLMVILDHGAGDYSIYGSLERASVSDGQRVTKGQVLGTVGISDPELGPRLHFEVRPKGRAVDPLEWLRARR